MTPRPMWWQRDKMLAAEIFVFVLVAGLLWWAVQRFPDSRELEGLPSGDLQKAIDAGQYK